MNTLCSFSDLRERLAALHQKKRVAVVCAHDESTRHAVESAEQEGLIVPLWIDADTPEEACREAVRAARRGEADVLMKGKVNTDVLLRAILDKEEGLLPQGRVLTHVTCAELPAEEGDGTRLLLFTDAAVLPYPTDDQRMAQLACLLDTCRNMGIHTPRISLINCSEKVAPKAFPFTAHYINIKERARAGEFGPCVIDGPLDLKTSLSAAALSKKGILSPIEGRADGLIFPDIQAANVFYKTITLFGCPTAGMLCGASVPVVLPSRGDSSQSKLASLMLAVTC